MPKVIIRNRVKELREQQEMTQVELAENSGCTRQTIIMLEQERYVPSLALAFSVAQSLNYKLEEVFFPEMQDE